MAVTFRTVGWAMRSYHHALMLGNSSNTATYGIPMSKESTSADPTRSPCRRRSAPFGVLCFRSTYREIARDSEERYDARLQGYVVS
nr:unnamed protein product [Digitaria exilis]